MDVNTWTWLLYLRCCVLFTMQAGCRELTSAAAPSAERIATIQSPMTTTQTTRFHQKPEQVSAAGTV